MAFQVNFSIKTAIIREKLYVLLEIQEIENLGDILM